MFQVDIFKMKIPFFPIPDNRLHQPLNQSQ